jgi:hypothetical protein
MKRSNHLRLKNTGFNNSHILYFTNVSTSEKATDVLWIYTKHEITVQ